MQVFPSSRWGWAQLFGRANKEIYSTCANSHTHPHKQAHIEYITHTHTRWQTQLNAILHGILKIFCPVLIMTCKSGVCMGYNRAADGVGDSILNKRSSTWTKGIF